MCEFMFGGVQFGLGSDGVLRCGFPDSVAIFKSFFDIAELGNYVLHEYTLQFRVDA